MMSKTKKILLILLGVILILTPFLAYYFNFKKYSFSDDPERWAQFGDYLNGTFMPLIGLTGIIITLLLGLISEKRNEVNLRIEQEKQQPLLNISYWDGELKLRISITNKGNGPLLIRDYQVLNKEGKDIKGIYYALPPLYNSYGNFTGNLNNTVIGSGEIKNLLKFEWNETMVKLKWEMDLSELRNVLKDLKIVVNYRDVYNNEMPRYEKSLEWFGREKIPSKTNSI